MATKRFVITTRDVDSSGDFVAEPGPMRFLAVPDSSDDFTPKHTTASKEAWRTKRVAAARWPKPDAVTGTDGEVLIFVGGYNTTTQEIFRPTFESQWENASPAG